MITVDIPQGNFSSVVKTGVYFSIDNDDRVFTGDLYYDFAMREFQLRGIPAFEGRMRHVFDANFKGPVKIHMLIKTVMEKGPRSSENYADLKFRFAKATGEFSAWIEEWFGDKMVMAAIEECWEIVPDLTWYKA